MERSPLSAAAALLGEFRGFVADLIWLQAHAAWEAHDAEKTAALVRTAIGLEPRRQFFVLNGARIVAFDLPAWRRRDSSGSIAMPLAAYESLCRRHAEAAVALVNQGIAADPENPSLWIERASLEANGLKDFNRAADSFRRASLQPRAPFFAARLHAEMLRRAGRNAEALAWLVRLHPTLPANDDAAAADTVLSRIRALEREVGIGPEILYLPPAGSPR